MSKKQDICSVCQSQPQDMLILSCRHNLCLDCATQVYALNSKNDRIVCQICLSQTNLDQDTIICLRSLTAKNIKQKNSTPQIYQLSGQKPHQRYPPIPKNNYTDNNQRNLPMIHQQELSLVPKCQKHNEALTYYCLQCNFHKICSQCMLLQNHRYHKVITLKKASVHIKQTIQKVGRQKLKLKNLLQKDRQSLSIRKQQSQKQLELNIVEIKQAFDEVVRLIGRKYEQIKKEMQQQGLRKIQIMQGAINQIQQKINLIDQTIQFEQELIKSALNHQTNNKGMLQMFQYYQTQMSQNKLDFQPSLPNYISQVTSKNILNQQHILNSIQSLLEQFIISSSNQQEDDQNINYISQIQNDNHQTNQQQNYLKQKIHYQSSMKKHPQIYQNLQIINQIPSKRPISQNINIIQHNPSIKSGLKQFRQRKQLNTQNINSINIIQPKKSKQTIEAIKRKARQNIRDKELSHSRKMQLSRSIQNATDILNKIQQRSTRI